MVTTLLIAQLVFFVGLMLIGLALIRHGWDGIHPKPIQPGFIVGERGPEWFMPHQQLIQRDLAPLMGAILDPIAERVRQGKIACEAGYHDLVQSKSLRHTYTVCRRGCGYQSLTK